MVVVDMTPTRVRISKRSRRKRRVTERRMRRATRSHHAEIRKIEAARKHRARAVQRWMETHQSVDEQKSTEKEKADNETSGHDFESGSGKGDEGGDSLENGEMCSTEVKKTDKSRARVRFAPDVLVVQIPTESSAKLPPPTPEPIGNSVRPVQSSPSAIQAVRAAQLISKLYAAKSRRLNGRSDSSDDSDDQLDNDDDGIILPDSVDGMNIPLPPRMFTASLLASISDDDTDDEEDDPCYDPSNDDNTLRHADADCVPAETPMKHMKTRSAFPKPRRVIPMCLSLSSAKLSQGRGDEGEESVTGKRPRAVEVNVLDEGTIVADCSSAVDKSSSRHPCLNEGTSPTIKHKKKRRKLSGSGASLTSSTTHDSPSDVSSSRNLSNSTTTASVADGADEDGNSDSKSTHAVQLDSSKDTTSNCNERNTPVLSQSTEASSLHERGDDEGEEQQQDHEQHDDDGDNDIDDLFHSLVRIKAANKATKEKASNDGNHNRQSKNEHRSERRSPGKINRGVGSAGLKTGARRYTEEGYRIMSLDEIASDQPAGLKGDCPFDCSCCF